MINEFGEDFTGINYDEELQEIRNKVLSNYPEEF
jgi:hypothetical protein